MSEIKQAIEQNPGGSDLEIALAIGVSEAAVKKERDKVVKKVAKKIVKKVPKKVPTSEVKDRYYLRDAWGHVFELKRMNSSTSAVVLEYVDPKQASDFR